MALHSFDPIVAAKVGVNAAVIYQNIVFWTEKNKANNKHYYEGQYWTYNSIRAFEELFPYLTQKQIRVALDKLTGSGLILVGNFNKAGYDRTKWYCPKGQMDFPEKANGTDQKGEPIPDIKPDIKQDNISSSIDDGYFEYFFEEVWEAYPRKVGKGAAKKALKAALKKVDDAELQLKLYNFCAENKDKDQKYVPHMATWLNQERWADEV